MTRRFLPVLALLLLSLAACSQEEQSPAEVIRPVKTVVVVAESSIQEKSYPAIVLPAQQAELSFRTSGQIIELPIKAATQVKEDDIIAKLDTNDLQSQVTVLESQKEQAEAQLEALTSGARTEDLAALKASIAAAEAQVRAARDQRNRTQQLYEKGIVAKAKLDADQAQLDVAEAQLEAARQELIKGESGARQEEVAAQIAAIKGIEANLNIARDQLSYATLRAPFDGIIARRDVDNFANVQAKQTIAILQKLDRLELSFDIPGPDVAKASRDQARNITVHLDAVSDKSFDAELVEFTTLADSSTQTFRGRVAIDQPEDVIVLPGMIGQVTITDNGNGAVVLLIPGTAIASDPSGNTYVWVVENNTVAKRDVTVGDASEDRVAIVDGLEEGETVVTAGVSFMQEGMKVRSTSGGA